MNSNPIPLLWTVAQTGAALNMSPWTIRYYVRTGKLRAVKVGTRIRIDPDDVLRLIEAGRTAETEVNVRLVRKVASQDRRVRSTTGVAVHA